ncbi:Hpt domain-containing protein [Grimontia sp. SpTr1]|uniref:Hpt domain-containing protein n=1 Tax=Grimontia sp. SpTr1 TaxID=2995319 RepID=UPI00248ABF16|nr:Hpt domain-containing protein [Grimontia sp. SpTr1]
MTSLPERLLQTKSSLFSGNLFAGHKWLSILLWIGFGVSLAYALISYSDMNHTRDHAGHVVKLNNAAQQLRQTVSASMINQSDELVQLEKEVQHFRYLLLRTKSHTIEDSWEDIQNTLLEADAFVEDVDNLLASIYSISSVTKQLKQLHDGTRTPELKRLLQRISSYLLFELHGLNDSLERNRIARFNGYIRQLESEFSKMPEGMTRSELFTLYTGLERLNRQLESVDAVINHKFVRSITQLQSYWTTRTLLLLDNTMTAMFVGFGFLVGLILLSARKEESSVANGAVNPSKSKKVKADKKPSEGAGLFTFVEPDEPLFEPAVLKEQLDEDEDAIEAVLTMFVAEHQNDGKTLRKHFEAKELARARTLIHNVKGVSGNIGAIALQAFCTHADSRLRKGEWIDENEVKHFEKLLSITIQSVLKEMENAHRTTAS